MTIASAAHAATHALPAKAAGVPSAAPDGSGSDAPFADQLAGLTVDSSDALAVASNTPKPSATATQALPKSPAPQPPAPLPAPVLAGDQPAAALALAIAPVLPRVPMKSADAPRPTQIPTAKHPASNKGSDAQSKSQGEANPAPAVSALATIPVAVPELVAAAVPAASSDSGDDEVSVQAPEAQSAPAETAQVAPPAITANPASAQTAQEMAFATRVQPAQNTSASTLPAEMASASAVASASKKIETAGPEEPAAPAGFHGATAIAPAIDRAATPAPSPAPAPAPAAHPATALHRAEAIAPAGETAAKPGAALKDISLQVNQPGKERVDVRVVQQGGEVHVSVHSDDTSLNAGLRQGLSELQSRLEESGYRSEMWRPGMSAAPVAAAPSAQASGNHSRGGDGQPQQQGGSPQDDGRRNPNQSNQPRWVAELESSLGAGERSTGGFYGFTS